MDAPELTPTCAQNQAKTANGLHISQQTLWVRLRERPQVRPTHTQKHKYARMHSHEIKVRDLRSWDLKAPLTKINQIKKK